MSTLTAASIPRMSPATLSALILAAQTSSNLDASTPPPTLAIIDVRDEDHIGGHIKHSVHVASSTLNHKIPELVRKLQDKETVVFHCQLSQMRGPVAALRYLRERERLLGAGAKIPRAEKPAAEQQGKKAGENADADADGEWEDVEEEQKVYILNEGFTGWAQKYGEDSRLTEGYSKELWKDGY